MTSRMNRLLSIPFFAYSALRDRLEAGGFTETNIAPDGTLKLGKFDILNGDEQNPRYTLNSKIVADGDEREPLTVRSVTTVDMHDDRESEPQIVYVCIRDSDGFLAAVYQENASAYTEIR